MNESIMAMNFTSMTPVQELAIPTILEGRDLIACAQTGTGKTAAYLIPVMEQIIRRPQPEVQGLILAPTRELAKQIDAQVDGLGYFAGVNSVAVYGGKTGGEVWEQQRGAIERGADLIVATPGRLLAHMQLGYVSLDNLRYLILDEADKMLDMGFLDDILAIVNTLPKERQTLLFSATMPKKMRQLAQQILRDPAEINIAISKPAEKIEQVAYLAYDEQKPALLKHLFAHLEGVQSVLVFTSRKSNVNKIVRVLEKFNLSVRGVSSDLEQADREKVMRDFRNREVQVLVATDVLSRGIDVDNISHVINYDVPQDPEDYIHRIGRTARAERTGMAITFINEEKQHRILRIEQLMERELPRLPLPEGLGESPPFRPEERQRGGSRSQPGRGRRDDRPKTRTSQPVAANGTSRPETAALQEGRPDAPARRKKKRRRGPRRPDGTPPPAQE